MTNYERICADKVFCAWMLLSASRDGSLCALEWVRWLDAEQREVSDERRSTMSEIERAKKEGATK